MVTTDLLPSEAALAIALVEMTTQHVHPHGTYYQVIRGPSSSRSEICPSLIPVLFHFCPLALLRHALFFRFTFRGPPAFPSRICYVCYSKWAVTVLVGTLTATQHKQRTRFDSGQNVFLFVSFHGYSNMDEN